MIIYSQPVFLPGSGTPYTPQRVKAARGPTLIAARSASITKAHRALALALTARVAWPLPEEGRSLPYSLTRCLVGHASLAAAPAAPLSSLVRGACRRV